MTEPGGKSKNPLTVLHSYPLWLPQTQTWMYNQIRNLPAEQVEAHIICEATENLDQFAVANLHSLRDKSLPHYVWDKALRKLGVRGYLGFHLGIAKRTSARILHSHFGNIGWKDLALAKRGGLRHVVTFYGLDVSHLPTVEPVWNDRYLELFASADRILCEGPHMATSLRALGCPPDKLDVLHIGIDTAVLPFEPRRWTAGEPLRVLIAGGFREKKGIPDALEALGMIRGDVELQITIIGDANDEPRNREEKEKILTELDRSGLQPFTRLMGYQPYAVLLAEARSHHLFLSPSVTAADGDTEGGAPVTIIEMMASGMPIVSTDHCDIPEVVTYGGADWLSPERQPEALAERLRWLTAHPTEWEPLLEQGRARAVAEFDVRVQARRLAELYGDLAT